MFVVAEPRGGSQSAPLSRATCEQTYRSHCPVPCPSVWRAHFKSGVASRDRFKKPTPERKQVQRVPGQNRAAPSSLTTRSC